MSKAPERIWVWSGDRDIGGERGGQWRDENSRPWTSIEYIRADLVPQWQPIGTAPRDDRIMFVVIAINSGDRKYTSDPVCVWRDGAGNFVRWKHDFPPTHWMPLPAPPAPEHS